MNILIVGGLLGLAVLAILGAVLLGISEDRADKAKKEQRMQDSSVPALLPQQSQSRQVVGQGPAYQSVPATPILPSQTGSLPVSSASDTLDSHNLSNLNGQVCEITSELRVLAQRAGELQQRLTSLSEVLDPQEEFRPEPLQTNFPADLFTANTETQVL